MNSVLLQTEHLIIKYWTYCITNFKYYPIADFVSLAELFFYIEKYLAVREISTFYVFYGLYILWKLLLQLFICMSAIKYKKQNFSICFYMWNKSAYCV